MFFPNEGGSDTLPNAEGLVRVSIHVLLHSIDLFEIIFPSRLWAMNFVACWILLKNPVFKILFIFLGY